MNWYVKSKRAQTNTDDETWMGGGVVPTVNGFDMGDSRATTLILYSMTSFAGYTEGGGTLSQADHKRPEHHIVVNPGVRRLMPIECERLQGFPDDWTAGQKDTPRYKQMGNAVAVPVVEWIMSRLVNVEAWYESSES
jgi:DNA (cytosine-5)-methyltransferase 1